jgi:quercetin dioxygenase-like cupin family protein
MKSINDNIELEKSKAHVIIDMIEDIPKAKASTTIMKKITGNITVSSFGAGEAFIEKLSPFDTYIQIIAGSVELIINETKHNLTLGQGIIIPAHARYSFNAGEQFKIIATIIKSGYED